VDLEDLLAGLLVGQVYEEDLVEAALAKELGRKRLDVIRRSDYEDDVLSVAHEVRRYGRERGATLEAGRGGEPTAEADRGLHGECSGGQRRPSS
jgi:hypothetical protein